MSSEADAVRDRLQRERARLVDQGEAAERAADTVELDQTRVGRLSRMDALQQQAMSQEEQRRTAQRRRQIDAALVRLDEGEYGDCLACGEPIASARLDYDPAAAYRVACAEQRERDGRA